MKIDRVVMTKDEAGWFSRNVNSMLSLLEASKSRNKDVTKRETYKTLLSMKETADDVAGLLKTLGEEPFEVEVILSRKQKDVFKSLLGSVIGNLKNRVIPTYKARLEQKDVEGDYQSYLDKAAKKAEMLENFREKLK